MKKILLPAISLTFLAMGHLGLAQSDAFHKNSLSLSVTGGSSRAIYSTKARSVTDANAPRNHSETMNGIIDPLILEFGLTDKLGVGFSIGGDYYIVDAKKFYNYESVYGQGKLTSSVSYCTADLNLHPLVTNRLDLSLFVSAGSFKVKIVDAPNEDNIPQTAQTQPASSDPATRSTNSPVADPLGYKDYVAKGATLRGGLKLRCYVWKRVGFMAMVTGFSGMARPTTMSETSFGSNYATSVTGLATEFGLCVRFF